MEENTGVVILLLILPLLLAPWISEATDEMISTSETNKITSECGVSVEKPRHLPVALLHAHGDAVVQLQPGDVAEPEHDAGSIGPADALGQFTNVRFGALP